MKVAASRVIADVRMAMNENIRAEPLLAMPDLRADGLDRLVIFHAPGAVDALVAEAPAAMLDAPVAFADQGSYYSAEGRRGLLRLPDDFLRLHSFRLRGWRCAATGLAPHDSPRCQLARMAATLDGGEVIVDGSAPLATVAQLRGESYLEFFGENDDGKAPVVEAFCYLRAKFDRNGAIEVAPALYDRFVMSVAERVENSIGAALE